MKISTILGFCFGLMAGVGLILAASTSREVTLWFDDLHSFWAFMGVGAFGSIGCLFLAHYLPKIVK